MAILEIITDNLFEEFLVTYKNIVEREESLTCYYIHGLHRLDCVKSEIRKRNPELLSPHSEVLHLVSYIFFCVHFFNNEHIIPFII